MNVTILYGTYSGGTSLAAEYLASTLRESGQTVTVIDVLDATFEKLPPYDILILSSPSYGEAELHEGFKTFIQTTPEHAFLEKRVAIFGLGDSSFPHFCEAVHLLETFVKEKEGTLFTPSLRIDGYFSHQDEGEEQLKEWAKKTIGV